MKHDNSAWLSVHPQVAYFSQWESPELVQDFISGNRLPKDDPLWRLSGADTPEEYQHWARHLCGMACLRSILATENLPIGPTLLLARECEKFGGYRRDGEKVTGLYYQGFVDFVRSKYELVANSHPNLHLSDISQLLARGHYVLASVHPSIRNPDQLPPRKGGHLVLVHACNPKDHSLCFHNPSGDRIENQANVILPEHAFAKFFAERGISVRR